MSSRCSLLLFVFNPTPGLRTTLLAPLKFLSDKFLTKFRFFPSSLSWSSVESVQSLAGCAVGAVGGSEGGTVFRGVTEMGSSSTLDGDGGDDDDGTLGSPAQFAECSMAAVLPFYCSGYSRTELRTSEHIGVHP